jgi:peptidoglycan/xylan/chitin deacetylase (PgdA/CDA1 family)
VATGADALRAEAKGGNVIGNHTYSHSDLVALGDPAIVEELTRTQQAVAAASGVTPHWFRPPYGAIDARVANIAASLGLHSVTWSVDPRDWTRPGVSAIVGRVVSAVQPGSIVELHDGGGDRSETVAAITILIPLLLARGYRFVTLDEMFFPHESLSTPPKPRRMCIRRVANDRCVWFAWVRP